MALAKGLNDVDPSDDELGQELLEQLCSATDPVLIGVRHHSPSLAAAMPLLLDAAKPSVIALELPADLGHWIPWLGHPDLVAPVALSVTGNRSERGADPLLAFYPFADFSPELAAIRWARLNDVPVVAIDLPVSDRTANDDSDDSEIDSESVTDGPTDGQDAAGSSQESRFNRMARFRLQALLASVEAEGDGQGFDELWDRLVEAGAPIRLAGRVKHQPMGLEAKRSWGPSAFDAGAPGGDVEQLRRAGLRLGAILRDDAVASGGVETSDLRREEHMRTCLSRLRVEGHTSIVAVVGSFHCAALVTDASNSAGPTPIPGLAEQPIDRQDGSGEPAANGDPILSGAEHTPENSGVASKDLPSAADEPPADPEETAEETLTNEALSAVKHSGSSLVPYRFDLLDSRSGYPAGIRDPQWQQTVYLANGRAEAIDSSLNDFVVQIARDLRGRGYTVSTPDATEAVRIARDLAVLRGLPAPARRELVEGVTATFVHGEATGRGRVVAGAMQRVLIGRTIGVLPIGAPRTGLAISVDEELRSLRLPTEGGAEPLDIRLEPWRSKLDLDRLVAMRRFEALSIPYGNHRQGGSPTPSGAGQTPSDPNDVAVEALTSRWIIAWEPATDAMLSASSVFGPTLALAADGFLRQQLRGTLMGSASSPKGGISVGRGSDDGGEEMSVAGLLEILRAAADAALPNLVSELVIRLQTAVSGSASFSDVLATLDECERLLAGVSPGLPLDTNLRTALSALSETAFQEALPRVESIRGSDLPADVQALSMLIARLIIEPAPISNEALGNDSAGPQTTADETSDTNDTAGTVGLIATAGETAPQGEGDPSPFSDSDAAQLGQTAESASFLAGRSRVLAAIDSMRADGSTLMQGAAWAGSLLLGKCTVAELSQTLGAWLQATPDLEARRRFSRRLFGALSVGATLLTDQAALHDVHLGLMEFTDDEFLQRAPALREGFAALSTADRRRTLESVGQLFALDGNDLSAQTLDYDIDPDHLTMLMSIDRHSFDAVNQLGLAGDSDRKGSRVLAAVTGQTQAQSVDQPATLSEATPAESDETQNLPKPANGSISALDRWRLVLGQQRKQLSGGRAQRAGAALEELYGRGSGEGSRDVDDGSGGGSEASYPTGREWGDELLDLFGQSVREEVLGRAAAGGRFDAALLLNPDDVAPSVELLTQVLSLRGSLRGSQVAQLRRIVDRVVADLVRALASAVRPALNGVVSNRVSRRGRGPLDLKRTLADNLKNARPTATPSPTPEAPSTSKTAKSRSTQTYALASTTIPEHSSVTPSAFPIDRFWFRERNRRTIDWRVVFVVDVSGSMEASIVYSAIMAAIVNALPAVSSHFVAFSTEVLDLSGLVDDPLGLLLEVSVGGGTNIAKGLAYVRNLIKVPARTIVILVSDFEEGGSVNALINEVRALSSSGVKLLGLAALDNTGAPRYERRVAQQVADAGMDVAALTPLELARWVGEKIK
jgi:Family of unknown function (DUF5682)/VWA domain containing CoxE-like protein